MEKKERRILRLPAVRTKLGGVSHDTVYRWVGTCEFPSPIKLGLRASGWYEDEIDAWLEKRAASRVALPQQASN